MRKLLLMLSLLLSSNAFASDMCSSFFQTVPTRDPSINFQTETPSGKPRYFSVKNYNRISGSELDTFLKSFKNLTQISEKLDQVGTFIPSRDHSIPAEAFFIANAIVPHIESFLRVHGVSYNIDTFYKSHEEKIKRTLIHISPNGPNTLNKLAKELMDGQGIVLVVDPMELFYGYNHYNDAQGRIFDLGEHSSIMYALSFHLVMHSQRKDFRPEFTHDLELKKTLEEIEFEKTQKIKEAPDKVPRSYKPQYGK